MDTTIQCLLDQLHSSYVLLTKAVADFEQQDFFIQLPNQGSSAYWIFGHLSVNEDFFISLLTGDKIQYDEPFKTLFQDDNSCYKNFSGKNTTETLDIFLTQHEKVKNTISHADVSTFCNPPPTGLPSVFDSVSAVWGIFSTHRYWHIGQLMSIRKLLSKPDFSF